MKKVYVFLANGFEEIEGLTVVDLLRRAKIDVTMVSIHDTKAILGSHNIKVEADALFSDIEGETADGLVLPGGLRGMLNLKENPTVKQMILEYEKAGKLVAAVCASPSIFSEFGLLEGKRATSYPSFRENLVERGAKYTEDSVARDGNIVTSRGVGTSIDFALALITYLTDQKRAKEVANSIVYQM